MDSELYSLCKQVYEATKWTSLDLDSISDDGVVHGEDMRLEEGFTTLYRTDYLLEKLPVPLIFNSKYSHSDAAIEIRRTKKNKYKWSANIRPVAGQYYKQVADTPLKAVLKLVLVLKEEGQI